MGSRPTSIGTTEERYCEPFTLSQVNTGTSGTQATATAINSTNCYIVCRNVTFSVAQGTAGIGIASSNATLNLIDGASGGTKILWTAVFSISSTGVNPISINLPFVRGSISTNMTAEFSAGITGAIEAVSMSYFSAK